MRVQSTSNYGMFQLLDFNRDVKKTSKLEASMRKYGFIPRKHIDVIKEGGKLKIKSGHHRFAVAQKLGLPIQYMVTEDKMTIHEEEEPIRLWTMEDYLTSYSRQGTSEDYAVVLEYHKRTGICISQCVAMLGGLVALGTSRRPQFKNGTFKIVGTAHAETVASLVSTLKRAGIKWATNNLCVGSLSRIVMAGHVNIYQFQKKIAVFSSSLKNMATLSQFTEMWEEIYNTHSRKKVPIAFLTNETMKEKAKSFGR